MKKFITRYINSQTGEADHIQVSDAPTHDHIQPDIPDGIPVLGVEPLSFDLEDMEVDELEPMRAKDYFVILNKPKKIQDKDLRFTELKKSKRRKLKKDV